MANTVRISSKYQIVIPRELREAYDLRPGTEVVLLDMGGVIRIVHKRSFEELRGSMKGLGPFVRDKRDREFPGRTT